MLLISYLITLIIPLALNARCFCREARMFPISNIILRDAHIRLLSSSLRNISVLFSLCPRDYSEDSLFLSTRYDSRAEFLDGIITSMGARKPASGALYIEKRTRAFSRFHPSPIFSSVLLDGGVERRNTRRAIDGYVPRNADEVATDERGRKESTREYLRPLVEPWFSHTSHRWWNPLRNDSVLREGYTDSIRTR